MTPGWQTLLAALGGLTLGLGLGLTFAYRRERRAAEGLVRARARIAAQVLPFLERRAERAGVQVGASSTDEVERAAQLASALASSEASPNLALSDTVDVSGEHLRTNRGAQ